MKPSSCAHCVTRTPERAVEYRGKTLWCCKACADEIEASKREGRARLRPPSRLHTTPMSLVATCKAPTMDETEDSQARVAVNGRYGLLTLDWQRKGEP